MSELFRLKIASKRQMTAPQRLLDVLGLKEGDEIQIEVADGQIVRTEACKVLPTRLFSPEMLKKLVQREAEPAGTARPLDSASLDAELSSSIRDRSAKLPGHAADAPAKDSARTEHVHKNVRSAS